MQLGRYPWLVLSRVQDSQGIGHSGDSATPPQAQCVGPIHCIECFDIPNRVEFSWYFLELQSACRAWATCSLHQTSPLAVRYLHSAILIMPFLANKTLPPIVLIKSSPVLTSHDESGASGNINHSLDSRRATAPTLATSASSFSSSCTISGIGSSPSARSSRMTACSGLALLLMT